MFAHLPGRVIAIVIVHGLIMHPDIVIVMTHIEAINEPSIQKNGMFRAVVVVVWLHFMKMRPLNKII